MSQATPVTGSAAVRTPTPNLSTSPMPMPQADGPPFIQGVGPPSGSPGDHVTIGGVGLTTTFSVVFNNNAQGSTGAFFSVISDSAVLAVVPNLAAGTYAVFVETAFGTSNAVRFDVLQIVTPVPPPTLDPTDPFEPKSAAAGQGVTINGQHVAQVTDVFFNGTKAAPPKSIGQGMLMVLVPNGASSGPIRIVAASGEATSSKNFIVVTAKPSITNVVPDLGRPGTTVEVQGMQLLAATVTFGGIKAKVTVRKERRLEAVVPELAPGPTTVVATNALGQAAFPFTVT